MTPVAAPIAIAGNKIAIETRSECSLDSIALRFQIRSSKSFPAPSERIEFNDP